jgi:aminoglycoside 3-N-acetyltransferase I
MPEPRIARLSIDEIDQARALFSLMAGVFETESTPLRHEYLARLLARSDFWAFAASIDGNLVGGLTAFTLPLTRIEESEVFLFDIAVLPQYQRLGIGRRLVAALRAQASAQGISVLWVPADNEDTHALDFYRALGGDPAPVTIFTFSSDGSPAHDFPIPPA